MFSNATLFGAGESGDEMLYGRRALLNDIEEVMDETEGSKGRVVSVTNYITVDGAQDPEEWASKFVRKMKQEARMA